MRRVLDSRLLGHWILGVLVPVTVLAVPIRHTLETESVDV